MNELVEIRKNQVVTSSRQVAEVFGKRHCDVLRGIQNLTSTQNCVQWFYRSQYKDASGKMNLEYLMNRDGFSLLVMGFTGKKALEWKIKYIEAFNTMEKALKEKSAPALPENPDRQYTFRGIPVMTSMQLEKLLHVVHAELLRRVKLHGLSYFLLQGKMLVQFKRENRICDHRASSMAIYAQDAVYRLAQMCGRLPAVRKILDTYFFEAKGEALDVRTKILQLYTLRSTIGYVSDWKKRRIVAEYIVDEMMPVDTAGGIQRAGRRAGHQQRSRMDARRSGAQRTRTAVSGHRGNEEESGPVSGKNQQGSGHRRMTRPQ